MAKKPAPKARTRKITLPPSPAGPYLAAEMTRLGKLRVSVAENPGQAVALIIQAEQALRDEYERVTGQPPPVQG